MTQVRPMLAAQKYREAGDLWGPTHAAIVAKELDRLRDITSRGLAMQPKIDGMRCMFFGGVAKSRSWKPLANRALQLFATEYETLLSGIDGEVVTGHVYDPNVFRQSMSGIRSADGAKEFTIYVFDTFLQGQMPYEERREMVEKFVEKYGGIVSCEHYSAKIVLCPQVQVTSLDEIFAEETRLLAAGWEGGIVRHPDHPYKFGRSTALGMELVKVKRRVTVDAVIEGYEQRFQNQNEAKVSELGLTTRSSHQENLIPVDMLGALHLRLLDGKATQSKCGVFRLSHDDLRRLWEDRENLIGRHCEVSMDSASGGYDSARQPVFLRFRDASEF